MQTSHLMTKMADDVKNSLNDCEVNLLSKLTERTSRIHRCPCRLRKSVNSCPIRPLDSDLSQLRAS